MRRRAALLVLAVAHGFVAAMAALFYLKARVAVADAFREYDTVVPAATALALSPAFLPAAVGLGLLLGAVGLLAPLRPGRRTAALAAGLVVSSFALVFAVLAAFVPIFRPAG